MENPHIQKALSYLQNANYSGYFEEMDKVEIPKYLKPIYAEHKSKFIQGLKTFDFYQQLEVFVKQVLAELGGVQENLAEITTNPLTDYKTQAMNFLEDGEIGEALKAIIPHTRGTKIHPTVIAINTSYKEYEKDRLAGKNVQGQLQDITTRVTELIEKL